MALRLALMVLLVCAPCARAEAGGLRGGRGNETAEAVAVGASQAEASDGVVPSVANLSSAIGNSTEDMELQAQGQPGGSVMTLYHTTSPQIAELILREGFKPGRGGWCGGAIYFIDQPYLKRTKFNPKTTKTGAIIEAKVDMGRMARMDRKCTASFGRGIGGAKSAHYDTLSFNPGDGVEYVIWSNSRVLSTRRYQ